MLFPFMANLFRKRITTTAPNGFYHPVRETSDTNLRNAFETTVGPPNLNLLGRGSTVGQAPGPQGAAFLPQLEYPTQPGAGLLATESFAGSGALFVTGDSNTSQEIF